MKLFLRNFLHVSTTPYFLLFSSIPDYTDSYVLTVVTMKRMFLWVVMLCSNGRARRFGGTYRLCLQCSRVNQAIKEQAFHLSP
jgi:hypothetical protein